MQQLSTHEKAAFTIAISYLEYVWNPLSILEFMWNFIQAEMLLNIQPLKVVTESSIEYTVKTPWTGHAFQI